MSEPFCRLEIITPEEYVGPLMELAQSRRGEYVDMRYLIQGMRLFIFRSGFEYLHPLQFVSRTHSPSA